MLNISLETTIIYFMLNGIVSVGFMFLFLEKLYERLYENSIFYVGAYVVAVFVNFLVALLGINILNSVVSIASIIGFVTLLYKVKRREAIIHSTAYVFGNVFAEVISLVVVASIVDISLFEILNGGFSMYLFSLINWIFLFVNYKFFSTIYKNKELSNISRREFVFFIVITLTEIYITTYILSEIDPETSGLVVMVILSAFFGFNIYVEYLLNIVNQSNEFKLNFELSQQQNKMQLKYYEDLMLKQEQAQQIIHDVKKHIMSLESLVKINEKEKAQNYSSELYERLDNIDFVYKCSNKILNIIINDKMREAEYFNIDFTINI